MKKLFGILAVMILATRLPAQTNAPVRLALIAENDEASAASDVLTAQLSGNPNLQLLERNEIEKVYREQGLSAGNKDYLKLGQVLGADGLLLMDVVRTRWATNLTAWLIAVKPGVILTDGSFSWPLTNVTHWAESAAPYLNSFLPKLALLPKDAIPISVVNLRSAIQSADGAEMERQLKLLAIQRLSRERQFFVLERQRMQRLSEEKELKADDSVFWSGSYLLEGVVDQNGYAKETITINARLTPPKGGVPLLIEVSGSRTNLAEAINRLAVKVTELLKVSSTVKEWNTAAEAQQYYDEARWALRWGVYSEAQAAADSAWALGKCDMDCALLRVKAYIVAPDTGGYQRGEYTNPRNTNEVIREVMEAAAPKRLWGLTCDEQDYDGTKLVRYVSVGKFPDPKGIDLAIQALQLYYSFGRTLPPDEPKADTAWYNLGIEALAGASQVLQHFNFVPESQKPVADKLADLRVLSRLAAGWISRSPSVRESYFIDRVAVYDELHHFMEKPSIFSCEVRWGCFWQERPEDGVALYRDLMSSPVFCYIHKSFWLRDLQTPHLAAWNENDRQRIPAVWNSFVRELEASTNVLLKLESRALLLADAQTENKTAVSFTNLFDGIFENRDALVANPVDVLYLDWGVEALVSAKTGNGISTVTRESLHDLYWHGYRSKLEALHREYQDKTVLQAKGTAAFEKQMEYLKNNTPYDWSKFNSVFESRDYTKAQAAELLPLLAAYQSNLLAQAEGKSFPDRFQVTNDSDWVEFCAGKSAKEVLNPPTAPAGPAVRIPAPPPAAVAKVVVAPEVPTNVIAVGKFLAIPGERLIPLENSERIKYLHITVTAHHWMEEKLLLDYEYTADIQWLDGEGKVVGGRSAGGSALAILDPATEHWEVIGCPEVEIQGKNNFYHRSTLLHGELFTSDGGQIQKYDFQNHQWQVLAVSDGNNDELFVVDGHLYAARGDLIFEILDGGKSTRILASTRRNPPVSALDREDLGTPTLFEGPNRSLRVCASGKIFTWTGSDWREDSAAPVASFPPAIFADGVLFRQTADGLSQPMSLSVLATGTNAAELCLWQKTPEPYSVTTPDVYRSEANAARAPEPRWKLPSNLFLANLPAAIRQSDLYLLVDHSETQNVVDEQQQVIVGKKILPKDGYNAALLYFSGGLPRPQKLFLKFDAPDGCLPVMGIDPETRQMLPMFPMTPTAWMFFSTNLLFFGLETPFHIAPAGSGGGSGKAGVWQIPVSQIEAARSAQSQIQSNQMTQAITAKKQAQKDLLAKYDRNHNNLIDQDEKEQALDAPAFIESELDAIDANHNGRLDAAELAYFDANTNKILDPKEQAGIDIAQHLFAVRLMKKFGANGDGRLNKTEFEDLFSSSFRVKSAGIPTASYASFAPPLPDDNHDGFVDLDELETFLKRNTRSELRLRGDRAAMRVQRQAEMSQTLTPQQMFKMSIEAYWQKSGESSPETNQTQHS